MKFKKLFARKKQNRRGPRVNDFMLESLEPRLLLSATPMTAAVVTTDHLDYAPGETAVITTSNQAGDGQQFAAGELVRFQVTRTDGKADSAGSTADVGPAGNEAWYVVDGVGGFIAHLGSDVSGDGVADWIAPDNDLTVNSSISTNWFVEEQYRHSSLLVTASGQESGAVATQSFTDAAINTTTVVASSAPTSTYGDTLTFTATVTAATGTARPVGSVEFIHDGVSLGVVSISNPDSGLSSTFAISVPTFSANLHGVIAVFTGATVGADTFQNSTSPEILQTVNKAVATITVTGYDVNYDTLAHTATGTAVGVLGENLSAGLDLSGTVHTNAGANSDIWTFSDKNYATQTGTVSTLIARLDATIVVNGFNSVYSATPPGPSGTPQGLFQNNSLPIPIRNYGTVLELSATGIANTNPIGLGSPGVPGVDGFRYVNQLYSADQDVTVTLTGAPTTDSSHYLSVFLRTQNPNQAIVNAYYITYEEAGATAGTWWVGRLINDQRTPLTSISGTHLANGDKIRATVVGDTVTAYSFHGGLWNQEVTHTMTGADVVSGPGYTGLLISGASPEINVTDVTGVLGAAAHGATGTVVGAFGESLSGLNLNGTAHENAGTYIDGWTFSNPNYHSISGTVTSTIAKADAAITVTGYNVAYDGAAHQATGTVLGVLGESLGGLNLSNTNHTNAGNYSDAWTFTDSTGNYKNASGTVNNSITAVATTTTISSSASTSTYGTAVTFTAAVSAASGSAAPGGTVEFFDGATSLGTVSTANSTGVGTSTWSLTTAGLNAGSHAIHAVYTATGAFTGSSSANMTQTVNKAFATVSVNGYTGTYDAVAHGATLVSAIGLNGENLAGLVTLGGETFTNAPGGTATWSFSGGVNYTNQSGSVAILITKAVATVSVLGYTGVYDAAAHGATGSVTGVAGDLAAAGSSLSLGASFTNAPGGTASWSFTGGTNYTDQSGTVAIVINQAVATVSVLGYTGVYDAAAHGATGSVTGVAGDLAAAGSSLSLGASFTNAPGGTASWSFTGGTNYTDQSGTVAIVINQAVATVSVLGYTGVYDAAAHGATGSVTGVAGDLAATGGSLALGASFTNAPGGTAIWTFSGGTNYTDQSGSVGVVISKATITFTVTGYFVTYDGNAHTATATATGVHGEDLSAGVNLSGTTHINVGPGSYTDTVTFTDTTGNYTNATKFVKNFITKATAIVTATSYLVTYDGNAHEAQGTATGVKGESLSGVTGTLRTNAGTYVDVVTYTDTTGNYKNGIKFVKDFIAKATVTLTVEAYSVVYDGQVHQAQGVATGVKGEVLSGLTGSLRTKAGTYTDLVFYTDTTGNYKNAGKFVTDFIGKATVTLTVTGYAVRFDGAAHTATATATGVGGVLLNGVNVSGTTHTALGTYIDTVTFTDVTGNYKSVSKLVKNFIL